MHVVFITRKWHGTGGMQRLSKDLWHGIQMMDGVTGHLCRPYGRFDCTFPLRVTAWSALAVLLRWRVHFLDAAMAPWGAAICLFGNRVTLTACGLDLVYPSKLHRRFLSLTLRRLDAIVCISEATVREALAIGVGSEKIYRISCGIWDVSPLRSVKISKRKTLITVGRLIPRKGVAWFLERVFPLLLAQHDVEYNIVGSGPDEEKLHLIIRENNLDGRVRLWTAASDEQRDRLLSSASLFIMPNLPMQNDMEGFGIVCVEAASRGIPVAAARVDGVGDAVRDGETGRFFEAKNADDCVRVITSMLDSPLESDRVIAAARKYYSWNVLLPQYRHVIVE